MYESPTFDEIEGEAIKTGVPNYYKDGELLSRKVYETELLRYLIDKQNCKHTCYWGRVCYYCLFCNKRLEIPNA